MREEGASAGCVTEIVGLVMFGIGVLGLVGGIANKIAGVTGGFIALIGLFGGPVVFIVGMVIEGRLANKERQERLRREKSERETRRKLLLPYAQEPRLIPNTQYRYDVEVELLALSVEQFFELVYRDLSNFVPYFGGITKPATFYAQALRIRARDKKPPYIVIGDVTPHLKAKFEDDESVVITAQLDGNSILFHFDSYEKEASRRKANQFEEIIRDKKRFGRMLWPGNIFSSDWIERYKN